MRKKKQQKGRGIQENILSQNRGRKYSRKEEMIPMFNAADRSGQTGKGLDLWFYLCEAL